MNPHQALIEAAETFLSKLEKVEPGVNSLIAVQLARTDWQYDGPDYDQEKTALLAAISSAKAAEEGVGELVAALKVENDRLQTANAALRGRLEDIGNQYAVDCL